MAAKGAIAVCPDCGKEVKQRGLFWHRKIVHTPLPVPDIKKELPMSCPECAAKDAEINRLKPFQAKADELQTKVQELANRPEPHVELPTVRQFIDHCEGGNCDHAAEWKAIKTDLVQKAYDAMPPDLVKGKAESLGLIPKEIIIRDIERLVGAKK